MEKAVYYSKAAEGPENGSAYWIHAKDNVRLRAGLWKTGQACKGTVFLFPGRTEYIELWGRTAADLDRLGYTAFAIDWRGQGLADRVTGDRKIGHVKRFSEFQMDAAAMFEAAEKLDLPKPWYLIGHSMGACIGFRALTEGLPVSACAFTAPMFGIKLSLLERMAAWPLTWAAQALGRGHIYAPGYTGQTYVLDSAFEGNKLTNDPDMYQHWVNQARSLSELQIGGPSMGWLFQALRETRSLSGVASPQIPCITFCGDQDQIVDIPAIQNRMERWPGGSLKLIKNAKHELFAESPAVRGRIFAQIDGLFSTAIKKEQAA